MKSILKSVTPDELNHWAKNTSIDHLGIRFTEVGPQSLKATMPVDHRTIQPAGILNGGVSVALAEIIGSTGAGLTIDNSKQYCVGLEINANHIRTCSEGFVEGIGTPLHIGKKTQVWEIKISQNEKLVCVSRITLMTLDRL